MGLGLVALEPLLHQVVNHLLVSAALHVDEIADDQAADVAESKLSRNLVSRLKICLQDCLFDVAATFAVKQAMLACHASQQAWLRKQHGIENYLETMERWTRAVGRRAGLDFAEGFRRYKGHPYPQTPVLEELVGYTVI